MRTVNARITPSLDSFVTTIAVELENGMFKHYIFKETKMNGPLIRKSRHEEMTKILSKEYGEPVTLNILNAKETIKKINGDTGENYLLDYVFPKKFQKTVLKKTKLVKYTGVSYEENTTLFYLAIEVQKFLNQYVDKINSFIIKKGFFAKKGLDFEAQYREYHPQISSFSFAKKFDKKTGYSMHAFTAKFGEESFQEAIEALQQDLQTAYNKELLKAFVVAPTIMNLSNLTGNGKKVYGLYTLMYTKELKESDYLTLTNSTAFIRPFKGFNDYRELISDYVHVDSEVADTVSIQAVDHFRDELFKLKAALESDAHQEKRDRT